jgi:signal transduction histidine kinase
VHVKDLIADRIIARLERVDPRILDWAVALFLTVVGLVNLATTPIAEGHQVTVLAFALVVLMNLPLVFRRRHPDLVLGVIGLSTIAYAAIGAFTTFGLGVLFALYSVAVYAPPRISQRAVFWTMFGITASFVGLLINSPGLSVWVWAGELLTSMLTFGVAWLLGDLVRKRSAALAELELRAAELEDERGENERLAVEAERARIARELHDAVAHNVSVMVVQAGATRRTLEVGAGAEAADDSASVETARDGLAAIEKTGRETLVEMRRMVGTLRPAEGEPYEPAPSLSSLDGLLERVRSAGLKVDLKVEGEARQLPQGVDLSAYRIVQEALTNTIRHAHAASAKVRLRYSPDALEVEVTDDGRGAASAILEAPHRGYGLVGMRERVGMIGGELVAGPRTGGGYEVRARLPLGVPA